MSYPQIVFLFPMWTTLWITQWIALGRASRTGLLPLGRDAEARGDEAEADHDVPVVQLVDRQGSVRHIEDDDPGQADEEHRQHDGRNPGTVGQLDGGGLLRRRRRVVGLLADT